ncbi:MULTISPECIES: hypothetical protein, partial [Xanthomonas]|uniref:hypothetical protein n=1 Tax=Xanthomonas cannabis TaxID=1885674 RepID=UPI001C85ABBD
LLGDLKFEAYVVFSHEILGVGRGVQLPGVTSLWGLLGGIHAAKGPAIGEGTAPDSLLVAHPKRANQCSVSSQLWSLVWAFDWHSMRANRRDEQMAINKAL